MVDIRNNARAFVRGVQFRPVFRERQEEDGTVVVSR
jgi:hypothetical protein